MTLSHSSVHHGGVRWMSFRNDSGEEAPPFAIMRLAGVETVAGRAVLICYKPNEDGGTRYTFNGPCAVADGKYGFCTSDFPLMAYYDNTSGTPAINQEWGAKNGSWKITKYKPGYIINGTAVDTTNFRVSIRMEVKRWTRFSLYTSLSAGGSATADVMAWTGAAYATTGQQITVYDFLGSFSGVYGDRGYAMKFADRDEWEVVQLEC